MPDPHAVDIPLMNPNEPEARVAAIHAGEGEQVRPGAPLCTLETTKSTLELTAEREGYVVGLRAGVGDLLRAGEILCWLADAPDWEPPDAAQAEAGLDAPKGLRITRPALALAERAGLDLGSMPQDRLITVPDVERRIASDPAMSPDIEAQSFRGDEIVIYGGGGHGKALIDLIHLLDTSPIAGVIDDSLVPGETIMGVPVLGGGASLEKLFKAGLRQAVNAVGGVGDISSRIRVFERILDAGLECPTLVHPTAFVEPSARLEAGVQVLPHAYVGSEAEVGFGCIVNTAAVISHDCVLARYANIAPGALLAGGVRIGEAALVGMGVTVNLNVSIGARARVGNSAVVKADAGDGAVVHAGAVWPPPGMDSPS